MDVSQAGRELGGVENSDTVKFYQGGPAAATAALMSVADLAMRRSSARISASRSATRLLSVLRAGSRGRIWRRMSAARPALKPRQLLRV